MLGMEGALTLSEMTDDDDSVDSSRSYTVLASMRCSFRLPLYVLLLNSCCIRFARSVTHFSSDLRLKWLLEECKRSGGGEDGGGGGVNDCSLSAYVTKLFSAAVADDDDNGDDDEDKDDAIGDNTSSTLSWLVV